MINKPDAIYIDDLEEVKVPRGCAKDTSNMIKPLDKMYFEDMEEAVKDEVIMLATNKRSPSKLFDNLMERFNRSDK